MALTITLTSAKGGVSKTTTSVNLAAALASLEHDVLVIDLDPQSSATLHFGINPRDLDATIADCLRGIRGFKAIIQEVTPYLDVAPSSPNLSEVAYSLSVLSDGYTQLAQRIDVGDYDYVIIDTQPSVLDVLTKGAIFCSDYYIIPVISDYLSLEALSTLLTTIDEFSERSSASADMLGILICQVDRRMVAISPRTIDSESIKLLRKEFGDRVFQTIIPRLSSIKEAPSHGLDVLRYAPDSPGADAHRKLAKEVIARCQSG